MPCVADAFVQESGGFTVTRTRGDEALFMLEQRVARGLRDEEGRVHAARGLDEAEPDVEAVVDVACR
ncbi:hypothetical protein [Streptomyces kaempferi]|uniref:Uncharacterized protein n=1 Tax=Streptomyces kaempferi TaxID=333725 RepID=A0ABW3XZ58_9ACTN